MNRIIVILLASVCLCAIILVGLSNFKEPKTIVAVAPNTNPDSTGTNTANSTNTIGTIGAGDPLQPSATPNGLSPQVVQDVLTASNGNPADGPRVNPIDMTPRANGTNGGSGQGSVPATGTVPPSMPPSMPPMTGTTPTLNPNSAFIPNPNPLPNNGTAVQPTTPVVVQQPNTTSPIQTGGGNIVMNQPGSTVLTPPATTPSPSITPPVQQPPVQPKPVEQQPPVQVPATQLTPAVTPKPAPSTQVATATVKGTANARIRFDGATAILVLSGDKPFEYKSSQLGGPDRLLLDLTGNWQLKSPSVPSNRLFNTIRVGHHTNSTRIVVDLKIKPASWSVVRVSDSVIELHAR